MPRTKQSSKRSFRDNTDEYDSLIRDMERQTAQRIVKAEAEMRMQLNNIRTTVDVGMSRLPTAIRKLMVGQLHALDMHDENEADNESVESGPSSPIPPTGKGKKKTKRVTAASDDGYATEGTTRTTHVSRINSMRNSRQARAARSISSTRESEVRTRGTRSSSRTRNSRPALPQERNDLLKVKSGPPTSSKFKTPSAKNNASSYGMVTPKVKPNTPLNLLRRPRDGEMVLSMQGSPLLVSSIIQERVANVNVPLHNGNVISLLPNAGLRLSSVPSLDDETMQQLKTLKGHIDMVIGSN